MRRLMQYDPSRYRVTETHQAILEMLGRASRSWLTADIHSMLDGWMMNFPMATHYDDPEWIPPLPGSEMTLRVTERRSNQTHEEFVEFKVLNILRPPGIEISRLNSERVDDYGLPYNAMIEVGPLSRLKCMIDARGYALTINVDCALCDSVMPALIVKLLQAADPR